MINNLKSLGLIGKNQLLIGQLRKNKKWLGKILRYVEVETHSYCNRICSFCPNSSFDRRGQREYFPIPLYIKILKELSEVQYSGWFSFVRYMEPLADNKIFDRVREARAYLSNAHLTINTNGDYFTQDTLEHLHESGLSELNIARYIDSPAIWSIDRATKMCKNFIEKYQLEATPDMRKEGYLSYNVHYKKMKVCLYSFDYVRRHNARGGAIPVEKFERKSPCIYPFTGLFFDSNGECLPCCNMRSDNPAHLPFSYGNIAQSSLIDLFLSKVAHNLRKELSWFSDKKPSPCQSCALQDIKSSSLTQTVWNSLQLAFQQDEPQEKASPEIQ